MKFQTELNITYATIKIHDIKVTDSKDPYNQLLLCAENYKNNFSSPISEIPNVQNARKLFRALKIEPTKHRPSSEALLRRAMKDKRFYSVNSLVDVCNWCALDFLLPNGVYDTTKLSGDITLRTGKSGESYEGVNNRQVNLINRYSLVDQLGPFGSPITDSKRTSIDLNTKSSFIIIYAPENYDSELLKNQSKIMKERIIHYCGGKIK